MTTSDMRARSGCVSFHIKVSNGAGLFAALRIASDDKSASAAIGGEDAVTVYQRAPLVLDADDIHVLNEDDAASGTVAEELAKSGVCHAGRLATLQRPRW